MCFLEYFVWSYLCAQNKSGSVCDLIILTPPFSASDSVLVNMPRALLTPLCPLQSGSYSQFLTGMVLGAISQNKREKERAQLPVLWGLPTGTPCTETCPSKPLSPPPVSEFVS